MELVFIRHAKAEDIHEVIDGSEDMDRPLTDKGKDKFAQTAVKIANKLQDIDSDQLIAWSSPAVRAMETAAILVQQMSLEDLHLQKFIYEGGLVNLTEAIGQLDADKTVLIFGHEPLLSGWIKIITGDSLKIRKGMAVSVELNCQSPLTGEIQWVVEPE